jgi:hypothetical protein
MNSLCIIIRFGLPKSFQDQLLHSCHYAITPQLHSVGERVMHDDATFVLSCAVRGIALPPLPVNSSIVSQQSKWSSLISMRKEILDF